MLKEDLHCRESFICIIQWTEVQTGTTTKNTKYPRLSLGLGCSPGGLHVHKVYACSAIMSPGSDILTLLQHQGVMLRSSIFAKLYSIFTLNTQMPNYHPSMLLRWWCHFWMMSAHRGAFLLIGVDPTSFSVQSYLTPIYTTAPHPLQLLSSWSSQS